MTQQHAVVYQYNKESKRAYVSKKCDDDGGVCRGGGEGGGGGGGGSGGVGSRGG